MKLINYIALCCFLFLSLQSFSSERKKVLVLHSYHQGLQWTDNVNSGIQEVMDSIGNQYELDYEYLDTKRNPSLEYLNKVIELYDLKLQKEKYDAIIVSDNNALSFVKDHREKYFQNTPIIFCGINHFKDELIAGLSNITGIAEAVDLEGIVDLVLSTRPNTKHLLVINDNKTTTARLNKLLMLDLETKYKKRLDFTYYEDQSIDELVGNIQKVKGDTSILLLTYNKDKNGKFISFQDNLDLLVPQSSVPVYIAWAFFISDGVLGGKVVSGKLHGRMAAKMVFKVIAGTPADSIPIYREPLDEYVANYKELRRFGINRAILPAETHIVNEPQSFYSDNKEWIHIVLVILLLATIIILVLSRAILRRIKAEKALLKEQGRLKISVMHERLLGKIGRLLNASQDFKNVLDDVLKLMTDQMDVARVSLYSFNDSANAAVKINSRILTKGDRIKDVDRFYFSEIENAISRVKMNLSVVSTDLSNLNEIEQEYYRKRNIKAVVLLPVMVENEVVGLMGFSQNEVHKWTRDEISIFFSTVNMIANAWERNSLMNARIEAEQKNVEAMRMLEESSLLASIGVLSAGITHEINQPLNAIKISADSVLFWQKRNPGLLPEMFVRKINTISEETSRIDAIIKHMRTFYDKPNVVLNETIDMVEGVRRSLALVKRQVCDHSIELVDELPKASVLVCANYVQFEQIVVNLIVNAMHSLDEVQKANKKIKLLVYQDSIHGVLEIHDNGVGIEDSIREKIYDPLFTTKGKGKGSGLGMAIVKLFIDRFQGEISNQNNEEGGASFILRFKLQD
ncbi:GAF domain-containing protein [Ancylomarina euxinus]|uniref:histidine kinase n=1 Tax=Ancylomarina euxinus TaxID=2283627 RepID=A0A425XZQ0_9BACT|nr:ABC transporter substrate binding protein [Ancylomarina euxinus]MCZ4695430.1 ABC transporter substrate binding protein [Ancylomarina euxinus]MUP15626.1 GAF domain-containing protein [Ancylomarina euxinus]RRG20935.1 GAF domain-containing protein [Ancylomarina euxinus]